MMNVLIIVYPMLLGSVPKHILSGVVIVQNFIHFLMNWNLLFQLKKNNFIKDKKEKLFHYLAHQTRKVYLNAQVQANLLELDDDGAVFIVDYKMRILPKSA